MTDSVRITSRADPAPPGRTEVQAATEGSFGTVLATRSHPPTASRHGHVTQNHHAHARHGLHKASHGASSGSAAHGSLDIQAARNAPAQATAHHAPIHHPRAENTASVIPDSVQHALSQAMRLEKVPQSWHAGLQFIMAQESAGRVGVRSRVDTARGLFQLTRASYGLNPNGAGSFGNALEEAQGGIRYIRQRYGTADNAAGFWRQRRWY